MIRLGFLVLLACLSAQAQFKQSKTCKFLTPGEAEAVIGAGAKLIMAIEDGACSYQSGSLKLNVQQPARSSNRQALLMGYESSAKAPEAKPLAGVGDRAHIKKGNSGYNIMFLKGDALAGVEVYGEGSDVPAVAEKLITAAKLVASRL
jgi:hypothetical protein